MEITLAKLTGTFVPFGFGDLTPRDGYRIAIKYSEENIDYVDLPKNADCHAVIDAMQSIEQHATKLLRATLGSVASVVELIEDDTGGFGFSHPEAAQKLSDIVVTIAANLPKLPKQEPVG